MHLRRGSSGKRAERGIVRRREKNEVLVLNVVEKAGQGGRRCEAALGPSHSGAQRCCSARREAHSLQIVGAP